MEIPCTRLLRSTLAGLLFTCWLVGCGPSPEREAEVVSRLKNDYRAVITRDGEGLAQVINLSLIADAQKLEEALELVTQLGAPRNLSVQNTPVTDEQMKLVGQLRGLSELIATNTQLSDEGMKHLSRLKKLTTLYLVNTNVSNESVPIIGRFSKMVVLDLSATKVSSDLRPMRSLEKLDWLLLRGLKLPDGAFDTIGELPGLSRLSLQGAEYSEEALQRLRKRKPGLLIETGPSVDVTTSSSTSES